MVCGIEICMNLNHSMCTHRTCCQHPANDSPSWDDVRAQHFIRRVYDTNNVTNKVWSKGVAFGGGKILKYMNKLLSNANTIHLIKTD